MIGYYISPTLYLQFPEPDFTHVTTWCCCFLFLAWAVFFVPKIYYSLVGDFLSPTGQLALKELVALGLDGVVPVEFMYGPIDDDFCSGIPAESLVGFCPEEIIPPSHNCCSCCNLT